MAGLAEPEPRPVLEPVMRTERLIAIRRYSITESQDPEANLATLASSEAHRDDQARLGESGLQEAAHQTRADRRKGRPSYVSLPLTQCLVLEAPDPSGLLEARDALEEDYILVPDVPLALPGPIDEAAEDVDGVLAAEPPAASEVAESSGLAKAREEGRKGAGAIVAVLDSGCDADHDEFAAREVEFAWVPMALGAGVRPVRGFDTAGHGTHVCGIAAGRSFGLAPEAGLVVASVIESERTVTSLDRILRGLNWLLRRVTSPELQGRPVILNLSLGFKREWLSPAEVQTALMGVRQALLLLTQTFQVLPVVAIGNDGPGTVRAPGYFPEVLSVGAVDANLEPATFSGGGFGPPPYDAEPSPDVSGFGVDVVSSVERDVSGTSLYGAKSGTSMASPYVAGVAALVAGATQLRGTALRAHLEGNLLPLQHPRERVGRGVVRYAL